ncbi:dihydroorotase [Paracoccaceae bacterium GXU_MW_L88]
MTTLTNARLIDPEAGTETLGWLRIEDGKIAEIGTGAQTGTDCGGLCVAPGIVDIGVKVGEPGERHKESYRTAGLAAAAGGVTTMVVRPDTSPALDDPETLTFTLRRAAEEAPVHVRAIGALTKGCKGAEMAEMGFLQDAGAVAFSDVWASHDAKAFLRCLTYAADLGALVIGHPQEPSLSAGAVATSSPFATLRGLSAVSPKAEAMGLAHDLALAGMAGARYHADTLSTEGALPVLRRARDEGVKVTAGVSIHHLTLNEYDIGDWRTFFKFAPPLRSEDDRMAMVEALAAGEIDIISSLHSPQDEESKRLPFAEAATGAVGLETMLPAAMQLVHGGHISLPVLWRALSLNPAKLIGLGSGRLAVGAPADLVLFDPDAPFVLDRETLKSKSKNTPYDGRRMQGRVRGTWVDGVRIFGEG